MRAEPRTILLAFVLSQTAWAAPFDFSRVVHVRAKADAVIQVPQARRVKVLSGGECLKARVVEPGLISVSSTCAAEVTLEVERRIGRKTIDRINVRVSVDAR